MSEITSSDPCDLTPDDDQENADSSWAVSLCFWGTLVFAAGIYAVVALAPKFCVWNTVRLEYRRNVAQLIELEDNVAYLERVETALETDPEFRDRVAGVSQSTKSNEELIPVSGSLLFGHDDHLHAVSVAPEIPTYHALLVTLASHSKLRISLLILAAFLTIFAFTFLNDAGTNFVNAGGRLLKSTAMIPVARYFARDANQTNADTDEA